MVFPVHWINLLLQVKQFLMVHGVLYLSNVTLDSDWARTFMDLNGLIRFIWELANFVSLLLIEELSRVLLISNLLPLNLSSLSLIIDHRLFGTFLVFHFHKNFDSCIDNSSSSFNILAPNRRLLVCSYLLPNLRTTFFNVLSSIRRFAFFAPPQTTRPYRRWHLTKLS